MREALVRAALPVGRETFRQSSGQCASNLLLDRQLERFAVPVDEIVSFKGTALDYRYGLRVGRPMNSFQRALARVLLGGVLLVGVASGWFVYRNAPVEVERQTPSSTITCGRTGIPTA
jgi:hypothetical protein